MGTEAPVDTDRPQFLKTGFCQELNLPEITVRLGAWDVGFYVDRASSTVHQGLQRCAQNDSTWGTQTLPSRQELRSMRNFANRHLKENP